MDHMVLTPEEGTYFTIPMQGGTIAGFHGWSDKMLDAIGVYKKHVECGSIAAGIICTNVCGRPGGSNWSFNESGVGSIKHISVDHVHSIRMTPLLHFYHHLIMF